MSIKKNVNVAGQRPAKVRNRIMLWTLLIPLLLFSFQNCGRFGSMEGSSLGQVGQSTSLPSNSSGDTNSASPDATSSAPTTTPPTSTTSTSTTTTPPNTSTQTGATDPFLTSPGFHSYGYAAKILSEAKGTGIHIYSFDTNLLGDDNGFTVATGLPNGTWDFSKLKKLLDMAIAVDPTAKFIIRPYAGVPLWWMNANPDELEQTYDGCAYFGSTKNSAGVCVGSDGAPATEPNYVRHVSLASTVVMTQWRAGITQLKTALDTWGYTSRVIAFTLTGQSSQEWISWDANFTTYADHLPTLYSKVQRKAYETWLATKYGAPTGNTLPTPTQFNAVNFNGGGAYAGHVDANVVDYYRFRSQLTAETIVNLAQTFKSVFPNVKVGAIYGYMNEIGGDPSYGHNALSVLLNSIAVDFINPMPSYQNRAGVGEDMERQPVSSLALHGKLILNDMDQQTSVGAENQAALCAGYKTSSNPNLQHVYKINCDSGDPASLFSFQYALAGFALSLSNTIIPATIATDTTHLFRFLAFSIARNIRYTYLSLWNDLSVSGQETSDLSDPTLLANVLPAINKAKAQSFTYDLNSSAQILVVSDEDSAAYAKNWQVSPNFQDRTQDGGGLGYHSLALSRIGLNEIGAPYDHVLLSDLAIVDPKPYKLVIFLNAWSVSAKDRQIIQTKFKNGGRVLMFSHGAGIFQDGDMGLNHTADLVGITILNTKSIAAPAVVVDKTKFPLFSNNYSVTPNYSSGCCDQFYAADPQASILGSYPGGNTTSMAIRVTSTWTSIWTATIDLPPAMFRDIARYAGVFLNSTTDDPFYGNRSYSSLVATYDGPRTLNFPKKINLYDGLTGAAIVSNVNSYTFSASKGGVYIFRAE